jgi:hypothetical protein
MRRQAAAGQSGDRSPHSKELTLSLDRSFLQFVVVVPNALHAKDGDKLNYLALSAAEGQKPSAHHGPSTAKLLLSISAVIENE